MLQKLINFYQVKIIKHLSERSLVALALLWTFVIGISSLLSVNKLPKIEVPGRDKTLHFLFYFVLTLLWIFALQNKYKNKSLKFIVVIVVIIYGMVIEIMQGVFTKNREADVFDVMANSGGALLALSIIFWLNYKTLNKKF